MGDWGIKASKAGFDVTTAAKENLLFSSKYPMLKIHTQSTTSFTISKTTLNGAINSVTTSITFTNMGSFPSSHSSGQVPYFFIFDSVSGEWEAISYTGKSGNSPTGVTRGYLGTTPRSHANGSIIVQGYAESQISHPLGFPPVHLVYRDDGAGLNYIIPTVLGEFGEIIFDASVNSSNLLISLTFNDQMSYFGDPSVLDGTYSFRYTIMADSITTPYY